MAARDTMKEVAKEVRETEANQPATVLSIDMTPIDEGQ